MRRTALVLTVVVALAAPAHAQSDRYSTPPTTEGPLVAGALDPRCTEEDLTGGATNGGSQGICEWHYSLLPTAESDPVNDYVATWLQLDADPPPGWCVTGIHLSYDFAGVDLLSASRAGGAAYRSTRRMAETLEVDAGGAASSPASVSAQTIARRGRVDVQLEDNALTYSWKGRSARPVSAVLGWQLRVPLTEPVYQVVSVRHVSVTPCRGSRS